ncbi:MAG: YedE-related selenium metabolism membrane protein, partial [Planctomycetes bacterium]|nr:YedE-related selenium metabolism membrane protein [Planctomycetota bacterium]
ALLVAVISGNLLIDLFWPGAAKQFQWGAAPIAHGVHLWNFLGLYLVGIGSILLGGCPFRQLVAAGQGNSDAAITLMGLLFGAAFCHNFGLAAAPAGPEVAGGPGTAGMTAVVIGIVVCLVVGYFSRNKHNG